MAFTDFQDPISPDELAGLAMEEVVRVPPGDPLFNNKWEAAHGPFESLRRPSGEENWTVLVQASNHCFRAR